MRIQRGSGRLIALAALTVPALVACGGSSSSHVAGSSSTRTTLPSLGSGSEKVGMFKINFTITGYYNVSGTSEAVGNGLTCTQMAANGTATGGGFNTWQVPWGASVTTGGHTVQNMTTTVDHFRSGPGNTTVHVANVHSSAYVEVDNHTFDAYGEGGSDSVTVNGDGSGSFQFDNAPDQNLGTRSGQMARVSGNLTWTCVDVPPSQAPTTLGS